MRVCLCCQVVFLFFLSFICDRDGLVHEGKDSTTASNAKPVQSDVGVVGEVVCKFW